MEDCDSEGGEVGEGDEGEVACWEGEGEGPGSVLEDAGAENAVWRWWAGRERGLVSWSIKSIHGRWYMRMML